MLKKVVEVKPKKPKVSDEPTASSDDLKSTTVKVIIKKDVSSVTQKSDERQSKVEETKSGNPLKGLLGYESSDDEED